MKETGKQASEFCSFRIAMQSLSSPAEKAAALEQVLDGSVTPYVLWSCREEIRELEKTELGETETLLLVRAMMAILEGSPEDAERLLQRLPKENRSRPFVELVRQTLSLEQLQEQLEQIEQRKLASGPHLQLFINRPSIRNDFRDFTVDWETLMQNPAQAEKLFCGLHGSSGHSAWVLAQAEALYNRNEDLEALLLIVGLLPVLEKEKDRPMLFVALMLQINIMIMGGQVSGVRPLMQALQQRVKESGREEWYAVMEAMEAWACLYDGDTKRAIQWLETEAPNEYGIFTVLDACGYLIKLRVYLLQGKYLAFIALANKLLAKCRENNRTRDSCEVLLLQALCEEARGEQELAMLRLAEGLELAERYHYERLVSNEGERMLRLLVRYRREKGNTPFLDRVIGQTRKTAIMYPRYLRQQPEEEPSLSRTERMVLHFLADGKKNAEIAELMDVKVDTVKAHCKHINQKLQTENRQQAVRKAAELGILDQRNEL